MSAVLEPEFTYEISQHSETRGLSAQQEKFVEQLVIGNTQTEAARIAGYQFPDQAAYRLVRLPKIAREIRDRSEALLLTRGAVVGVNTLIKIAENEKAPAAARVQAANSLLDRAGIGKKETKSANSLSTKPIGEMDLSELDAFIKAGTEALNRQRSNKTAEDAQIIDVDAQISAQQSPQSLDT
jgi:hypothetical protein